MKINTNKARQTFVQRVSIFTSGFLLPAKGKGTSTPFSILKEAPVFLMVGIIATILDWSLYAIFLSLGLNYIVAVSMSFFVASTFGFIINKKFTFRTEDKVKARVVIYFGIAISAWVLTVIFLKILMDTFSPDWIIWKLFLRGTVTLVVFVYNYFMHKYITFRSW